MVCVISSFLASAAKEGRSGRKRQATLAVTRRMHEGRGREQHQQKQEEEQWREEELDIWKKKAKERRRR